jgi:hypothetical protein
VLAKNKPAMVKIENSLFIVVCLKLILVLILVKYINNY